MNLFKLENTHLMGISNCSSSRILSRWGVYSQELPQTLPFPSSFSLPLSLFSFLSPNLLFALPSPAQSSLEFPPLNENRGHNQQKSFFDYDMVVGGV
jgi:hypothetical protein